MENKHSKLAWAGLVAGVAAYDLLCPPGETLSEGIDRGLESKYRHVIALGVGMTALHLVNVLPPAIDPLHQLTRLKSLRQDRE
jgi:hypothetical protein